VLEVLKSWRNHSAKKLVVQHSPFSFPNRLWSSLASKHVGAEKKWADLSNAHLSAIAEEVAHGRYEVNGKSTFKDEFVTAGGISLKEVDFKTMQSKKSEGLFFAGEVLDIDAVTGGFNFQAAWTTATIAAQAISESLSAK
jgi:predicted Rossmann fold flavoprotein